MKIINLSKDNNLNQILNSILEEAKKISNLLRTAPLNEVTGVSGNTNATNDETKKLDEISEKMYFESLSKIESVYAYISEESEEEKIVNEDGEYQIYIDPLDGSSNIDVNVGVGTIFGIAKNRKKQILVPGNEYICAGYIFFGPATILGLAVENQFSLFVLDGDEFKIYEQNFKMPEKGKIYSVNEGYSNKFNDRVRHYLSILKSENYKLRYSGAMVSDIHRIITKGGIYIYPSDKDNLSGKLRLMYELNPIAKILNAAGGGAVNGLNLNICELTPNHIHERSSFFGGSVYEVLKFQELF